MHVEYKTSAFISIWSSIPFLDIPIKITPISLLDAIEFKLVRFAGFGSIRNEQKNRVYERRWQSYRCIDCKHFFNFSAVFYRWEKFLVLTAEGNRRGSMRQDLSKRENVLTLDKLIPLELEMENVKKCFSSRIFALKLVHLFAATFYTFGKHTLFALCTCAYLL